MSKPWELTPAEIGNFEWTIDMRFMDDYRKEVELIARAAQKKLLDWLTGFCDHEHSNAYAPKLLDWLTGFCDHEHSNAYAPKLKQLRFLCPNCMSDLRTSWG